MIKFKLSLSLVLGFLSIGLSANELDSIGGVTRSEVGKRPYSFEAFKPSDDSKRTLSPPFILDISEKLNIRFSSDDKMELRRLAGSVTDNGELNLLIAEYVAAKKLLEAFDAALKKFTTEISVAMTPQARQTAYVALNTELFGVFSDIESLAPGSPLLVIANDVLGTFPGDDAYPELSKRFRVYVDSVAQSIDDKLADASVRLELNYSVSNDLTALPKRAPMDGLFVLTAEQQAAINGLGTIVVNNRGMSFEEALRSSLTNMLSAVKAAIKAESPTLKAEADKWVEKAKALVQGVQNDTGIDDAKTSLNTLLASLTDLKIKVDALKEPESTDPQTAGAMLASASKSLGDILDACGKVIANWKDLELKVANIQTATVKAKFTTFIGEVRLAAIEAVKSSVQNVLNITDMSRMLGLTFGKFKEVVNKSKEFTEINDIEDVLQGETISESDLIQIQLKLVSGSNPPNRVNAGDPAQIRVFQTGNYRLDHVLLIYAQPTSDSKFKPGASISRVFHRGSTTNVRENEAPKIGWGLNLAALDFNNDDTFELGFGAVATFFGDFVHLGLGYNVNVNRGYLFFGLRIGRT